MWLTSLLTNGTPNRSPRDRSRLRPATWAFRPRLEYLEDRTLLSTLGLTLDEGAGPLPEVAIQSYSWGATNPGAASPSLKDFTLTLTPGSIEPGLWGHLAAGKHLDSATIHVRSASGQEYLTYTLSNVTISSFTTNDNDGAAPVDTIGLHFDKITESYSSQKPDGSQGTPNTASYNQKTNISDGAGSLQGESTNVTPPLTFVENGEALRGLDWSSYSWGVSNSGAAAPSVQDFTLTLTPGSAEVGLWGHLVADKHLDSVIIQLTKVVDGRAQVYTTYTLSNVTISSFTTNVNDGTAPVDTIGLHFDKITESYSSQKPDGSQGTPNTASYNQKTNISDGAGSLEGESTNVTPPLTFVENGVALHGLDWSSYSWGATNPAATLPSVQDFTLTLTPGSAEAGLWGHLVADKHLDSAIIQLTKVVAGRAQVYATYTLSNVTISSFTTNDNDGTAPVDTIGLHFDKITESYSSQKPDGSQGAKNTASYNQKTNTSDGAGSLQGESTNVTPPLTFVENGEALRGLDWSSYSWGVSNSGAAAPSVQDFTLTLTPGSAEAGLWGHLVADKHLDSVIIQLTKVVDGRAQVYTTYTLSNVTISSFTTNDNDGTAPVDTIGLHFDKITESYSTQKPDGSQGDTNTASYNQKTNISDGAGSLEGESTNVVPPLTFVENGVALQGLNWSSYSWGVSNSGAAAPSLQDFTLTLTPGSAEVGLWGHLVADKHLDSVIIQLTKVVAGRAEVYATYTLSNVTISSFTTNVNDGTAPVDTIGLHFDKITESYSTQKPDGSQGASNTASYNQKTNISDGAGSLEGESTNVVPPLTFVENGVALHGLDWSSYSWGVSNSGAAAPSVQDFTLTLTPGSAEAGLWGHLVADKHLDSAIIQLTKVVAGRAQVYATYTLSNVTISSFTTNDNDGTAPVDTIGLHFDKITESYSSQKPDGSQGATNTASYNQKTNTSDGDGSLGGPSSTTSLIASSNSTVYGNPVTFTATVAPSNGGKPTGTIDFFDGAMDLSGPISLVTVNGQQVASFTTATLGAGTHTITAQYVDPTNTFTDSSGTTSVVVAKAALTVTANDQWKITGEANPTFTVSYSGFVLGEGPTALGGTLTFSTSATTSSPPGTYAITPGGLTSSNYTITFVSGNLTVLSLSEATTNLLVDKVDTAGLAHGIQNSFDSQLQAAIDSFNAGNTTAGKNQLGAFINHVRAQSGKKIATALADALIANAQRILNAIG